MIALTLWPEWIFAITHLGKLCENRSWRPPASRLAVGQRFALHAGKYLGGRKGNPADHEAIEGLRSMMGDYDGPRFKIRDVVESPRSAIVATAVLAGFDRHMRTSWDVPGAWHWRLKDLEVLPEPIACGGSQNLWDVPTEIVARMAA